ncbi:MAG: ATP-dependent DNA helicase RecG [Bacilli bacterium]|nr:ATP-dependent DNA helicase RecG [Bacilli bacterium]
MLEEIKGIGLKTISEFNKLNINTVEDLLTYYPFRYDYFKPININEIDDDKEVVINGYIQSISKVIYIKRNLNKLSFNLKTDNVIINVVIFNRAFLKNNLKINKLITLIGKYNKLKNTFTASDIKLTPIIEDKIEPIYHLTANIKRKNFNKIIDNTLNMNINIPNYIPNYLNQEYKFIDKKLALKYIHQPASSNQIKQSKLMLTYEELFIYMLKLNYLKQKKQVQKKENIKIFDEYKLQEFINNLPFKLTEDQNQVLQEIIKDFKSPKRMNRLILGDVGSGKTIMAFISLYINFLAGYQGVIMVPTEILAYQHFKNFKTLFKNYKIKAILLTSSTKIKERKEIIKEIKDNKVNIAISTHSVLNEEIIFHNLGLVITDEQHRFGVKQRKNLQEKGKDVDVIYMSATPIPRTLALTIYGDMDISFIKTKPQNNKEIITKLISENDIKEVLFDILEEIKKGHQVYVIVPLVNENEELNIEDINSIKEKFDTAYNKRIPIGTIHGKIKAKEKEQIMNDFKNNIIKILISTTVIEVGIDVKNATTMVIFNAERFGLATLHQLRGRVGRSDLQSKCFLISNYEKERLKVLEESNDGFYISEKDFQLRGTGDLFGVKQSGDMNFKIANLKNDYKILLQCQKDSENFLLNNLKNIKSFPNQEKILESIIFID